MNLCTYQERTEMEKKRDLMMCQANFLMQCRAKSLVQFLAFEQLYWYDTDNGTYVSNTSMFHITCLSSTNHSLSYVCALYFKIHSSTKID